jgi:HEAT repeat protein
VKDRNIGFPCSSPTMIPLVISIISALFLMNCSESPDFLIRELKSKDHKVRESAEKSLIIAGYPTVNLLKDAAKDEDPLVRQSAIRVLGGIRHISCIEPLVAALSDQTEAVRREARSGLMVMKNEEVVDVIIKSLGNNDSRVRKSAAEILGRQNNPRAIDPLIAALGDEDQHVRSEAVGSLTNFNDPRVKESLVAVLKDPDPNVRKKAAIFLGEQGDSRALETLLAYLEDKDEFNRERAAWALSRIGKNKDFSSPEKEKAIAQLSEKLLTNWNINKKIPYVLGDLGWEPKSEEQEVHLWVAGRNRRELTRNWPLTQKVLLKDVETNDYQRIENALYAFIGIGNKEIIPILIKTLEVKGSKTMAEAYLNCGSDELHGAAVEWAQKHGYQISRSSGASPVEWGKL